VSVAGVVSSQPPHRLDALRDSLLLIFRTPRPQRADAEYVVVNELARSAGWTAFASSPGLSDTAANTDHRCRRFVTFRPPSSSVSMA
jgi:hypothetical protein